MYIELERTRYLATNVFPLVIKYTGKWVKIPVDGAVGLGGLTVQAHCVSG